MMKRKTLLGLVMLSMACSPADPSISQAGDGKGSGSAGSGGSTRSGSGGSGGAPAGDFQPPAQGGGGGTTNTGGNPPLNPDDKNCGLQTFKLQRRPAELMLVLDRSGSMNQSAPGSMTTKWADVTGALDDTIMKTQSAVLWGLKAFPTGDVMCGVNDGVEVASATMNYTNVWAQIQANAPGGGAGGGTPTTVAIDKTVAYLKATPSQNPRYLVLATDGEPNCGMGTNTGGFGGRRGGGGFGSDDPAAIMAVANAAATGFKTFVIGVATGPEAENVLTGMAMAGGEPRLNATPPYYPVASKQDLIDALGTITGLITDCTFRLTSPPPSPPDVAVNVGSSRVTRDTNHMNGWDYNATNDSIQFFGPACDAVKKASGQNVQIIYGCPGVVIK